MEPSDFSKNEFRDWNEEMVRRFPSEDYYEKSNRMVMWIERRRLRHIASVVAAEAPDVLIEVGCGACHVLERLDAPVRVGLDLSETMLRVAAQRTRGTNIRLLRAEAENLPFDGGAADVVVCTEVLEHVPDPEAVVIEVKRILKPRGLALFTVPHEETIDRVKRILRALKLDRLLFSNVSEERAKGWHIQDFTLAGFRKLLEKHYEVERIKKLPFAGFPLRYAASCRSAGGTVPSPCGDRS